jgi:hypothetical protein
VGKGGPGVLNLLRRMFRRVPTTTGSERVAVATAGRAPVVIERPRPPLPTLQAQADCIGATSQGNESRLTPQWSQYLEEILWVPGSALTAPLDGSFVGDLAYEIEGEMADHGHVLGSMPGAQA